MNDSWTTDSRVRKNGGLLDRDDDFRRTTPLAARVFDHEAKAVTTGRHSAVDRDGGFSCLHGLVRRKSHNRYWTNVQMNLAMDPPTSVDS